MNRKIAAILAADVAGYSRLVANDEEGSLHRLIAAQAIFKERVAAHRGRIFNTAGDAILAEFPSAVEAARAAVDIQQRMAADNAGRTSQDRLQFRIGLHVGDVVEHESDLLGDGVNVAARLQELAPPGGLAISQWTHEHTASKISVVFRDIGRQPLKNIPVPVHVFLADLAPKASAAVPTAPMPWTWPPWLGRSAAYALGSAALAGLAIWALSQVRTLKPAASAVAPISITAPATPLKDNESKSVPPTSHQEGSSAAAAPPPKRPDVVLEPTATPTLPVPPPPAAQATAPQPAAATTPAVMPPVVAPKLPRLPVEADSAPASDRKGTRQRCAEVLERAQLGEISADDRAFLRNQCR